MQRWMFLIVVMVCACGSDDKKPAAAADSGGVCPAELGDSQTWAYSGSDDSCKAVAAALNEADDSSDDGPDECAAEAAAFEIRESGGDCEATLVATCDGMSLDVACAVEASGAATCNANVKAGELDCELTLTVR